MIPRSVILFFLGFVLVFAAEPAPAETIMASGLAGKPRVEKIAHWDVDKLNAILTDEIPKFASITVRYTPAKSGVDLYRITYSSLVPEHDNKPIVASGLLAVPDTTETTLPLVSYQHGTIYGRHEAPSFADDSPETQLMIAQFAGQGYALIAADYFGLGISEEPESYLVKASQQQACYDLLVAAKGVLAGFGRSTDKLFLAGWSQGGFVTMAFLERLEEIGGSVDAAATASAPPDLGAAMRGFLYFPRPNDAPWLNSIFILLAFSFENYYDVPGLARSLFNDDYYDEARRVYERKSLSHDDIPMDLHKLIRTEYFDDQFFSRSKFGKLVSNTEAYRWVIRSPVRNYYGEADEIITVGVGKMAKTYAQALGTGNQAVEAVSTGETTHRGTFVTAVASWKTWFDQQ